jgi:hypothetical protein
MNSSKPSASVIIAAILAILGSLFAMLCLGLGLMGLYLGPAANGSPEVPAIPQPVVAAATAGIVFLFVLSVVGIITGIGLFQLKNWARMSALIWAGIAVLFCTLTVVAILIFPFPTLPTAQSTNMTSVKALLVVFYGIPIVVGVWWLILFNQKNTRALFTDNSVVIAPAVPLTPRCPLPVAIIAGFMLFSVVGMFMMPLMHLPVTIIFFGQRLRGELGAFLFASTTVLYLAAAIGLLSLKRWSYPLAIGLQIFWMISGTVTFLRPNYMQNMREIITEMHLPETSANVVLLVNNRFIAFASLVPGLVLLGILLRYRKRFLQAVAAAESLK